MIAPVQVGGALYEPEGVDRSGRERASGQQVSALKLNKGGSRSQLRERMHTVSGHRGI